LKSKDIQRRRMGIGFAWCRTARLQN